MVTKDVVRARTVASQLNHTLPFSVLVPEILMLSRSPHCASVSVLQCTQLFLYLTSTGGWQPARR